MRKMKGMVFLGILALLIAGCGNPAPTSKGPESVAGDDSAARPGKPDGPAATVAKFLEAVRTGNDENASKMLSKVAREKTAALNRSVTPPASDTARFSVGKVKYVGEDGARVAATWTDLDENGEPKTDEAVWVLRLEEEGWRIAGVAPVIFPGEPPLLLNFEDPEDIIRKLQWVREEIHRRMNDQPKDTQAQTEKKSEKKTLR